MATFTETEQLYPTLERLSQEIELLKQTHDVATHIGKLFVSQLNMAFTIRRETRGLRDRVHSMIQKARVIQREIDSEDELCELLVKHQQATQRMAQFCNQLLNSKISIGARWLIRWSRRLLIASHADLEGTRIDLINHNDAVTENEEAYWAAEATAVLGRIERGEERVITLEQWEARHGLGG